MRGFFVVLLSSTIVLASCSGNEIATSDVDAKLQDQLWTLVRMNGSFEGSMREGDAMEWQEEYRFYMDGYFEKIRILNGDTLKANGTFEAVEYDNDPLDYLELTFTNGLDLVGSCLGNNKEVLRYVDANLLMSTWQACDGPGLEYALKVD
jgi:hypothetical protein